jgi:glucosamine-6-phosphate deaminase
MPETPLRLFETPAELGVYAARCVGDRVREGIAKRNVAVVGCPSGRSLASTYGALGGKLADLDGTRLHLLMMDEFIEKKAGKFRRCPPDVHFSCARFGEEEIRLRLNQSMTQPIPAENLHLPDPSAPERYEALIEHLGGIDVFLLASGTSDGHVAFNPPGTPAGATTRCVELADTTRKDNMKTFPEFRTLDEVPHYGVTVGPETISRYSRSALLVLTGREKALALGSVRQTETYDPSWPASVIHLCRNSEILVDREVASAAERRVPELREKR